MSNLRRTPRWCKKPCQRCGKPIKRLWTVREPLFCFECQDVRRQALEAKRRKIRAERDRLIRQKKLDPNHWRTYACKCKCDPEALEAMKEQVRRMVERDPWYGREEPEWTRG